ncbi:hypothetical protein EON66_01545 [archaeon]|nr:MAG: hypothetical protein EON66_01545 [archaeon]
MQHAAAVKSIGWVHDKNALVTGSWDRTMKVWDCRTPTPQASVAISDRCVSMDVGSPVIIMGTGDDKISVYNIGNLSTPYRVCTMLRGPGSTVHCTVGVRAHVHTPSVCAARARACTHVCAVV